MRPQQVLNEIPYVVWKEVQSWQIKGPTKLGIELTKYIQFFYECSDKIILNITDLTNFPV